jgi:F420-non-reducing hydrogenase small subunit
MDDKMGKPKIALYWSAACGGCDVAVLDINEKILDVAELADIVFWPIALDFKYHHVEAMADGSIDLCLFNGAIRSSEQEKIAKLLRGKSKVMVAFGSCACFGGIPALANLTSREEIMRRVYVEVPSVAGGDGVMPQLVTKVSEGELELPELYESVAALGQIVKT